MSTSREDSAKILVPEKPIIAMIRETARRKRKNKLLMKEIDREIQNSRRTLESPPIFAAETQISTATL